ncbi:MAG: type II toxin-antitoxin system PemK/MazF family toxin [Coriobacteriia bacterium]|nr:type II toxin-antitoxin system PemK/MazF family toxin [Coriobacteriia bacterium]
MEVCIVEKKIRRGAIFYADLPSGLGSEQSGRRPVVIIQNDIGNDHSDTVIVAAITSKTERKHVMPTHCRIQAQHGLARVSYILLEQIQTIDKSRLCDYVGTLGDKAMRKLNKALIFSVGLR